MQICLYLQENVYCVVLYKQCEFLAFISCSTDQRHTMKIALFAAFVCLAAALPSMRQVQNMDHPDRIPGEFLIVLHRPASRVSNLVYATKVASKIVSLAPKVTILNMFTNLMAPILHVKTTEEAAMNQLFQLDEIDAIDVDMFQHMIEQCGSQDTGSRIWGLSRTSSRALPDYSAAQFSYDQNDGSGVRVYIHDTSIRLTHNDFGGRAEFGANFVGGSNDDNNGHGCLKTLTYQQS